MIYRNHFRGVVQPNLSGRNVYPVVFPIHHVSREDSRGARLITSTDATVQIFQPVVVLDQLLRFIGRVAQFLFAVRHPRPSTANDVDHVLPVAQFATLLKDLYAS